MANDAPTTYENAMDAARLVQRAFGSEADDAMIEATRAFAANPPKGLEAEAQKLVDRGAGQLAEVLKKYDASEDKPLRRDYLDASYAELFLGVALKSVAPQESVYCGPDKVMYEKQYFQVLDIMEECEFKKPDWFTEPEDHIACEWAFLIYLLDKASEAHSADDVVVELKFDEAIKKFKTQHLDVWEEKAFKDIVDRDDVGFYTGFVNVARGIEPIL